jgi:hypothetical protein
MLDGGGYSVGGSGFYRRALKLRTGSISTPSGKGSASKAMWKGIAIEYRWGEGNYERLPRLAAELLLVALHLTLEL